MDESIVPQPLSSKGRIMIWLIVIELFAIWFFCFYAYATLPENIITHFDTSGKPTSTGDKSTFLFLPFTFSIAPVIFLVITKYRFTLINKYPYLVNLPAFYTKLYLLPENKRGLYVNKYFELVLSLGVGISLYLILIILTIYQSVIAGYLPVWFLPIIISLPILMLIPFFIAISRLSGKIKEEINQ